MRMLQCKESAYLGMVAGGVGGFVVRAASRKVSFRCSAAVSASELGTICRACLCRHTANIARSTCEVKLQNPHHRYEREANALLPLTSSMPLTPFTSALLGYAMLKIAASYRGKTCCLLQSSSSKASKDCQLQTCQRILSSPVSAYP